MKKFLNAIIVLIAFHSSNTFAQDQNIETIVVTAALINATETLNPIYVINGDDFMDGPTQTLGDAIDGYLGISIADYGAAVGQPIIRGMSGPRVKILKNGMVNRDVSGLGADHLNDLDLNDIQQLEIVMGPSSLLYANGTSGGIINVVDDCISALNYELPELTVGYETQSVNDGTAENVNFKNNINGFNVNFGFKRIDFGNYDVPFGAVLHEEEHDDHDEHDDHEDEEHEEDMGFLNNSDYAVEATKFGISKVEDWGYVGFSVDNLESVYGIPFHGEEHEDEHGDEEEHEEERIFSTTDSESFTIKGSYNVNGNLVNKVDFTFRESEYTLTEAHAEEEGHDDHEDEEEHAPTVFSNDATEIGAIFDISNDSAEQKIVFNIVDEDNSIIGEEAFMNPAKNEEFTIGYYISKDLDLFNVDLGMRMDQIERSGSVTDEDHGDIDNYNIDDTTNSFAVTIGRELTENLDISLGYASVERLPSVVELFMNGPHLATGRFEVGDPNLNSETSNNFDITLNYENDGFYAYASFYVTDVDNYIALIDEEDHEDEHHEDEDEHHEDDDHGDEHEDEHDHGNLIHANYMQEDAEFDGYEFEIGRNFDFAAGELNLSFGRDVVNAEFSDGHFVPRINPARNIYSLSYKQNDVVFKLNFKDVDKKRDVGEGETVTKGYRMLDTRITKTFNLRNNNELKVSLFGKNLLDEVARNHSSFVKNEVPLPGKNIGVKFNLTF
jgi:iron complex outermembrane receptor protein